MKCPLLKYRKKHGLTLKGLASEMDVSTGTAHRLEKNFGNLTIRKVLSWCERSGVNPSDIFPA